MATCRFNPNNGQFLALSSRNLRQVTHLHFVKRLSCAEIATQLGISRSAVYHRLKRAGRPARDGHQFFRKVPFESIQELYKTGLGSAEIARKFGVRRNAVAMRLKRYGLVPNRPP